jgi:putative tryptophan/tyrosine transport system substrate-binding protein
VEISLASISCWQKRPEKRLELLLELVPAAKSVAHLGNPTNPVYAEADAREAQVAARAHGVHLFFVNASRPSEIETAFAELVQQHADALHVSADGLLLTHLDRIVALAARHSVPTIYAFRQAATLGGLMSYGTDFMLGGKRASTPAAFSKVRKPADLPVQQVTKMELILNLKTAKTLGLDVPLGLSASANEVIE